MLVGESRNDTRLKPAFRKSPGGFADHAFIVRNLALKAERVIPFERNHAASPCLIPGRRPAQGAALSS